ncbi:restriction endonuclease subunit S [Bacteroides fragilis]|nr:restriction endonuclease subunit S [Bacteroides fragilis]MCE9332388.1 restriction endonuclease subunit S [Bacteroides fragilis]
MSFKNGMNPDAKRFGRGTKFISVMDILNNQFICYDNIRASVEVMDGDIDTYGVNYGDILFQRSSETLEDVGQANVYLDSKPAIFGGFVIRGKSKGNYNPLFFRYLLASPTARKRIIVKGAGAQHFNIGQDGLSKVSLDIPCMQEQKKIGELLQCIDARIATQNKIIEDLKKLKSAIVDYTFTNDTKSWRKQILLSDISTKIIRKNTDNRISNVLSNSANQGVVPQSEVFDREIANEDNTSNYFVISQNDFVYNPRKSVTAPYGPINKYNGELDGVISPLYLCFRTHDIDVDYLVWYFKSRSWYEYVYKNGDSGVRHDRVSIKDEVFFSMPLNIHSTLEQKEIAQRLNGIERFVRQEEQYLSLIQSQKDYLLQQMFI